MSDLRSLAIDLSKKTDPSQVDFGLTAAHLKSLFEQIDLSGKLEKEKLTVYSLGCGICPEATACLNLFSSKLDSFVGYDFQTKKLLIAEGKNSQDERLTFKEHDLQTGLPEGNPDLVIIRHPNVFVWEKAGQEKINPTWESVFRTIKDVYPDSYILTTVITPEEAQNVALWLNSSETFRPNKYSIPLEMDIKNYGTFQLPMSFDSFYLLSNPNFQT